MSQLSHNIERILTALLIVIVVAGSFIWLRIDRQNKMVQRTDAIKAMAAYQCPTMFSMSRSADDTLITMATLRDVETGERFCASYLLGTFEKRRTIGNDTTIGGTVHAP